MDCSSSFNWSLLLEEVFRFIIIPFKTSVIIIRKYIAMFRIKKRVEVWIFDRRGLGCRNEFEVKGKRIKGGECEEYEVGMKGGGEGYEVRMKGGGTWFPIHPDTWPIHPLVHASLEIGTAFSRFIIIIIIFYNYYSYNYHLYYYYCHFYLHRNIQVLVNCTLDSSQTSLYEYLQYNFSLWISDI